MHGFFSEIPGPNNKSFFGSGNHIVVSVIDSSKTIFSDNDITALSDEFIMKLTRFSLQQLREILAKCDGNIVNWFN